MVQGSPAPSTGNFGIAVPAESGLWVSAEVEMESPGKKSTQGPARRRRKQQQQPGHGKDQISEGRKHGKICTGIQGSVGNHMVYQEPSSLVLTEQDIHPAAHLWFPKLWKGNSSSLELVWTVLQGAASALLFIAATFLKAFCYKLIAHLSLLISEFPVWD